MTAGTAAAASRAASTEDTRRASSSSREVPGGAIMSTSLRVLMLEVNYRHLPLYQVLDQSNVK